MKALLALEDGLVLTGRSFTGPGEAAGEVVFNTSMTGYQEILTDPSYKGQIVTMTYPLIGNYGVNPEDVESRGVQAEGFIIKEYHPYPSNWRSQGNLAEYLKASGRLGVEGIDTRAVTKRLREAGAMRGLISTLDLDPASLVRRARELPSMEGANLVDLVTCAAPYWWDESSSHAENRNDHGLPVPPPMHKIPPDPPLEKGGTEKESLKSPFFKGGFRGIFPADPGTGNLASLWQQRPGKKVVLYDYGVKFNIIRNLKARGLEVLVVPAATPAAEVLALNPAGIVLSNGPGDPAAVTYAIANVRQCLGQKPVFGICLGHQLLGLALGGRTFKLKFGHRGGNQPVKNLLNGRVEITSQNHGFAVDLDSIPDPAVEITHINLNDNTLEGLRHAKLQAFSVQYHPEASPGPHDADYLFDEFLGLVQNCPTR
ncbi:MAG: glutamine-hydrolyzing carbamoyl-phosphate synthase small subunit [Deltaproteobacteria bacterium]|nr:glutamine-hydrolyzing carbamoyl-phosphate synthase small subunit [Deltaproteobacteria bacterium]